MTSIPEAFAEALQAAVESGEPIGWQVLDPDGNVVDSGPVVIAELTADAAERLGLTKQEGA